MSPSTFSLRARWVFPVEAEPIPEGIVTVCEGRIAEVGTKGAAPLYDLGNMALVPGFVNAHTHLEFSDLARPLETPGSFDAWIRLLISVRRDARRDPSSAMQAGMAECARSGTTLVGEIASSSSQAAFLEDADVRSVVFLELIGLDQERAEDQQREAARHLDQPAAENRTWGLSPHAPYSVRPSLLREAVRLARQHQAPLAIHLAETPEELQLLAEGSGPLAEMLKEFGAWQEGIFDTPRRALDVLQEMTDLQHGLVVHGNYVKEDEIKLLAACRENLTVVYCPRTHAYFRHPEHPFRRMLAEGVSVALGTDSRASNPDLSVLKELRYLHQEHPDLDGAMLLRLGTLAGATALGQSGETGSLRPGKRADIAVIALPDREEHDPHSLILAPDLPVVTTLCRGRPVYSDTGRKDLSIMLTES